jgi:hypothetical protein
MSTELAIAVEQLRYVNTKWAEKKHTIADQLRGAGIANIRDNQL